MLSRSSISFGHAAGDAGFGVLGGDAIGLPLLFMGLFHADVGDDAPARAAAGLAHRVDVRARRGRDSVPAVRGNLMSVNSTSCVASKSVKPVLRITAGPL